MFKRLHIAYLYNTHPDISHARLIAHKQIVSARATIHYIKHREKKNASQWRNYRALFG